MPCAAQEFDKAFVNCATPPLAAAYAGTFSPPWKDTKDAICVISAQTSLKGFRLNTYIYDRTTVGSFSRHHVGSYITAQREHGIQVDLKHLCTSCQ